jgi:hypothetical protein
LALTLFNAENSKAMYENLENLTSFVGDLIKSFGGLKGIILMVVSALTSMY